MTELLKNLPPSLLEVARKLIRNDYQAWLVGGSVRDLLLGLTPHDWDLATSATPEQIQDLFNRTFPTGIQHGTITVLWGSDQYEVTTFRGEGTYLDGRRPDQVHFLTDIREDLARRDFTINAIAMHPLTGELLDPFGGAQDLENKILRCCGNPQDRLTEDGLRSLRGCRFAARFSLELDVPTRLAMASKTAQQAARKVSPERVQQEVVKILETCQAPSKAFRLMRETGLLQVLLPELVPMCGCGQNRYHAFDVWDHTMLTLDSVLDDLDLRLAALLHDIGKPATRAPHPKHGDWTFYEHEHVGADMTHDLLRRLRFSTDTVKRVTHLVRHHYVRYESSWSDSSVRRWVRTVGSDQVATILALSRADIDGKGPAATQLDYSPLVELEARILRLSSAVPIPESTSSLSVSGRDLMDQLGIPQGPQVGAMLKYLLEHVTDHPEDSNRDRLLLVAQAKLTSG